MVYTSTAALLGVMASVNQTVIRQVRIKNRVPPVAKGHL